MVSTLMHSRGRKFDECAVNGDRIKKLHFKSKKNIFAKIIKKYSRRVKRCDVIDLKNLTIVEDGGYVRHMKARPFAFPSSFFIKDSTFHKENKIDLRKESTSPQKSKTSESTARFLVTDNVDCIYSKQISRRVPLDFLCSFLNDLNSSKTKGSNNSHRKSNKICLSMSTVRKTKKAICKTQSVNSLPYPKGAIAVLQKSPSLNNSVKLPKAVDQTIFQQSSTPKRIKKSNHNTSVFETLQDIEKKFTTVSFNRCSTPIKRDWSPKVKKQLARIKIDDITL